MRVLKLFPDHFLNNFEMLVCYTTALQGVKPRGPQQEKKLHDTALSWHTPACFIISVDNNNN
jgi:hypothetical protein